MFPYGCIMHSSLVNCRETYPSKFLYTIYSLTRSPYFTPIPSWCYTCGECRLDSHFENTIAIHLLVHCWKNPLVLPY